jgi:hypothetical protein
MFKVLGRFWEDVKRETTKAAHNTEKAVGKAWEDTKRESTRFAHDVERETTRFAGDVNRELVGIPEQVLRGVVVRVVEQQVERVIHK